MTYKELLSEEKKSLEFSTYGGADDFSLYKGDKEIATYYFTDNDAVPVMIFQNKTYIGNQGEMHKDMICRLYGYKNYSDFEDKFTPSNDFYEPDEEYQVLRDNLSDIDNNYLTGRIWIKSHSSEFPYSILYFWGASGPNKLKSNKNNVKEIANKLGINTDNLAICIEDSDNDWKTTLISYNNWLGIVPKMSSNQETQFKIHNLPPEEKWRATATFRDVRDHKNADTVRQFGQKYGKENMSQAEYNSLRQEEGKKICKGLIITEKQFKKLFKNIADI